MLSQLVTLPQHVVSYTNLICLALKTTLNEGEKRPLCAKL